MPDADANLQGRVFPPGMVEVTSGVSGPAGRADPRDPGDPGGPAPGPAAARP